MDLTPERTCPGVIQRSNDLMTTVKDLLKARRGQVWSVSPEDTVYEALQVMAEKDVGAVLVIEDDKLVGILSERDYARKVILEGRSSRRARVRELMTEAVLYVRPEQTLEECMALMSEKRVRHLPVLENDRLVGVVSIGDVVNKTIADHEFVIEQLENYITGGRIISAPRR
jgi:CBS domain-containing protein